MSVNFSRNILFSFLSCGAGKKDAVEKYPQEIGGKRCFLWKTLWRICGVMGKEKIRFFGGQKRTIKKSINMRGLTGIKKEIQFYIQYNPWVFQRKRASLLFHRITLWKIGKNFCFLLRSVEKVFFRYQDGNKNAEI